MMSKGSKRRPCFVSDEELTRRWADAFGKPDELKVVMCQSCGKPPAECQCMTLNELAARMGMGPVRPQ